MTDSDTTRKGREVSDTGTRIDDEDTLDALVQRASTPSLATLFKRGKEKGLIQPQKEYGHTG